MTQEAQQVVTHLAALKLALEALEDRVSLMKWQKARDAVKEALAQHDSVQAKPEPEQEPVCPDCKAKVLYECVACSSNNYPPQRKPLTDEQIDALALVTWWTTK